MVNVSIQSYCESDISFSQIWIEDGFSPCFHFTLVSTILLIFSFAFGMYHFVIFQKRGTRIHPKFIPWSCSYIFQQVLSFFLLIQFISLTVWRVGMGGELPGYILLYGISGLVLWLWAIVMLVVERRRALLMDRTEGHSTMLVLIWMLALLAEIFPVISLASPRWWSNPMSNTQLVDLSLWFIRLSCTFMLLLIGMFAPGTVHKPYRLLINEEQEPEHRPKHSKWEEFFIKFRVLLSFMWPKGEHCLQLQVLLCLVLMGAERVVNLLVPIYFKHIVDNLSNGSSWESLCLTIYVFIFLKLLQGGGPSGILSTIRSRLWLKVQQFSNRDVQLRLFKCLHSLSLHWHLQRDSGGILKSIERGITCINSVLSYTVFGLLPTIVDIFLSLYICLSISPWFCLFISVNMMMFLGITIVFTERQTKIKRLKPKEADSSLNYQTVKFYNTEEYEFRQYQDAILKLQKYELKNQAFMAMSDQMHNFEIGWGLFIGCLFCARFVTEGRFLVGDFVLFVTYMIQLYTPLNWLGTYYTEVLNLLGDLETLIKLFEEEDKVKDDDDAHDLICQQGKVEFEHVYFSYINGEDILKDVSFTVEPGQTVALVGDSGSGRSTIILLLLRLYDVKRGRIRIDGQDITKVKQASLRAHIGVVPQDTVLFNDNIRDNIRYGRISASDQQVEEAAVAADIHDKIMSFPDGYDTQVGERGLQLSGGEKQRVAITRTILKDPQIILLDEATSSLDTQTERKIQTSIDRVCANRTTVVVTHRLSTIIGADQICVLNDGHIVERGRHEELLASGGLYADLWRKQQTQHSSLNT